MNKIKVFVTVGTHTDSFDRLLSYCLSFFEDYSDRIMLTIQHGYTKFDRPLAMKGDGAMLIDFLSRADQKLLIKNSDVVITHAGIGTINECFGYYKKPIIVPRIVSFGEHTDPSQIELCRFFNDRQLAFGLDRLPSHSDFFQIIKAASISGSNLNFEKFKRSLRLQLECDMNDIIQGTQKVKWLN